MYISNIKLWNFRKFGSNVEANPILQPNLDLHLTKGLNVIIGENDSGKTAIIDAIKLVLKTHSYDYIKVEEKDFHKDSSRFRIELRFDNLSPEEAKNFTEWLGWTGTGESAEPYLKVILDVSRQGERIMPSDVRAGVDEDGYPLTAEARDYLKATYLKPLRDAESELIAKKNSRLSQILLGDEAFKGKTNDHDLVKIFNELNSELRRYFKGEEIEVKNGLGEREKKSPQEGKAIKTKIDGYVKEFYSTGFETQFEAVSGDIKSILEKITLTLMGESNPGLGTLNRLFMAAELLHLDKDNWSGIRLGLIEELEAHLHPQAQMQVIEALQKQDKIQLILTTHSPNLASKLKLESLIICNNGKAFPMGKNYTKLDGDDYLFLERFLDTTKANLFFAKGVILVEGWAEELLIPTLANKIGINLTEKSVSIVNVGNLAFLRYAKIFLRKSEPEMETPVAVITDVDIREYEKNLVIDHEGKPVKNDKEKNTYDYQKIDNTIFSKQTSEAKAALEKNSEKNLTYFIAPSWTFEYSLLKSKSLGTLFKDVVKSIHTGTDWDTNFEKALAAMLINKGLKKTEIAYQMAQKIENDSKEVKEKKKASCSINIDITDVDDTINYLVKAIKHAARN